MSQHLRNSVRPALPAQGLQVCERRGLTLVELTMALTITSMLSVVMGGLVLAVQTAWEHTTGLEDAEVQARAALARIKYMVSQAGTYQQAGQSTWLGLAVIPHKAGNEELPDVLVVWSGGRDGGLSTADIQTRLPRIDELVIYAPAVDKPGHLVEVAIPSDTRDIDFDAIGFDELILALLESPQAEAALLCDRLRVINLADPASLTNRLTAGIRFDLDQTPNNTVLAGVIPGGTDWYDLPWPQGLVSSESGIRQATLRIELQLQGREPGTATGQSSISLPFFGSASVRYAYAPSL